MGPDGGSATDDRDEDVPGSRPLTCATCGEPIDPDHWHPVRTRIDADGQFHLDAFCSMACRAERTTE